MSERDIIKEALKGVLNLKSAAHFSCMCEGCREEISYPYDMLAIYPPTGETICEGCFDESPERDSASFSDLEKFDPFAAIEAAIATLNHKEER